MTKFPDEIKTFINASKWTYAKTMPEWPHYYIIRHPDNEAMFVKTVEHIRSRGYEGLFYKQKKRLVRPLKAVQLTELLIAK